MPTEHDASAPVGAGVPPVVLGSEPSDAEHARTLAAAVTVGALSTVARDLAGEPYGSLVPFGLDGLARPVLCISELAEHTRNLQVDARSSLLLSRPVVPDADPLAHARMTLVGRTVPVADDDVEEARSVHLAANPHAAGYVDFGDFALWRLEIDAIRFVGGYGHMSWVDVQAWRSAEPDPVDRVAAEAIEHLNADHADACLLMAQRLAGRTEAVSAVVTAIDRYGLDLLATGPDGAGRVRLGFDEPITTPSGVRAATVALARRARA